MHSIRIHRAAMGMVCTVLLALTACGGGGGGGGDGPSASDFDGTWFGNIEDTSFSMGTVTVTISGGNITSVLRDGVDQGLTGTIEREQGNIWAIEFSDGSFAGFIADDAAEHAAFLTDTFEIGAVEKGATGPLPTYITADVARSASGTIVTLDSNFELVDVGSSTVECDTNGDCTGSDTLFGPFEVFGLTHDFMGRYLDTSGATAVFLTPNKAFAASYTCESLVFAISQCSFNGWRVD